MMKEIIKEDKIKIVNVPVIFWNVSESHIAGKVVGMDYELIGEDPEKLKMMFSDRIQRDMDAGDDLYITELNQVKFHNISVKIRPAYHESGSIFPVSESLKLNIPMVSGWGKNYSYECFFPVFRKSFHCYRKDQIRILGEHFAKDIIQDFEPAEIYSHLLLCEPRLDEIRIKVKLQNDYEEKPGRFTVGSTLSEVAEKLPHAKGIRQKIKIFPQTAWEQKEYIERVHAKVLDERVSLLITGDKAVGKSAVINEVIRRLDKTNISYKPTFWRTTTKQIISGAKYLGEWQEICENLIEDLENTNGILWLEDIMSLIISGGEAAEDSIAAFIMPMMKEGRVQIIAEMTIRELEAARRMLPGFIDLFQIVRIDEMNKTKTLRVFDLFNEYIAANLNVNIESDALDLAYRMLNRFMPYEKFPGKAINFLSQVASKAIDENSPVVKQEDVVQAFIQKTGMPDIIICDELLIDKNELTDYFSSRIIGQEEAIRKITSVIKVYKTALNNPYKPISTMIFAGPTGVGKTASAKLLADYFFGHDKTSPALIRLDMSEFQHPGQISRLIGSEQSGPGKVIQQVREKPFCVVLFDEIEKANPVIYDVLMTMFDEGILVDAYGRVTDFRNAIIIMTTNLGSRNMQSIGLMKSEEADYTSPIKNFFRPEFFNRIDHIVTFKSLGADVIKDITRKELRELAQREGFVKNGISLNYSEEIVEYLSQTGFDKDYGARPLQRTIEKKITAPVAKYMLKNKGLKNCELRISLTKDKINVETS